MLGTLSEEVRGVKIHIDAHIPICRGLGSSAALLVAGAMGANVLRGNKLSTQGLLNITNAMEGHPDNLAPAFLGGLTASMVDGGLPVSVSFPLQDVYKRQIIYLLKFQPRQKAKVFPVFPNFLCN